MAESLRKGADGPTRVTPSAGARARDVSRDPDAEKAGIRAWLAARDADLAADDGSPAAGPGGSGAAPQEGSGRPESS
jgi:hypothetical protein